MSRSKIEWLARPGTVGETWNPIQDVRKGPSGRGYHCTKVSEECEHCWAETMNKRFGNGYPFDSTVTEFELLQDVLEQPLSWRKPRTVFVQSMGDLFHEEVPDEFICEVWLTMTRCPKNTFIVLTKRAKRMQEWLSHSYGMREYDPPPLPNVIGMVTAGNQKQADERIPWLLKSPFALRGVSIEPMLAPIDLYPYLHVKNSHHVYSSDPDIKYTCTRIWNPLDWVIVGAETGPGKRYMDPKDALNVRDQCRSAGIPFFFKKNSGGTSLLYGKEYHEWPDP